MLHEILYAENVVLIAKSMAESRTKFHSWKSAHENKGLSVNLMEKNSAKNEQNNIKRSCKKDPCDKKQWQLLYDVNLVEKCKMRKD